MTTVAAWVRGDLGEIAADCRASDDNGVAQFNTPKLHRIGQSVYGVAGDDWVDLFIEWRRRGSKELPARIIDLHAGDVDFNVIELAPDGIWLWNRTFTRVKILDHEFAIGSGELVALYCMRVRRENPKAAVAAAALVDPHTGGGVHEMLVTQRRRKGAANA